MKMKMLCFFCVFLPFFNALWIPKENKADKVCIVESLCIEKYFCVVNLFAFNSLTINNEQQTHKKTLNKTESSKLSSSLNLNFVLYFVLFLSTGTTTRKFKGVREGGNWCSFNKSILVSMFLL